MNILGFALRVCVRLHENTGMDVLVQRKNHITLHAISNSGHKWIARKEYEKRVHITCPLVLSHTLFNRGFPERVVVCSVEVSESLSTYTVFPQACINFFSEKGAFTRHSTKVPASISCSVTMPFSNCSVEKGNEKLLPSHPFLGFVGHCHIAPCFFLFGFQSPSSFISHPKLLLILLTLFQGFLISILSLLTQEGKKYRVSTLWATLWFIQWHNVFFLLLYCSHNNN